MVMQEGTPNAPDAFGLPEYFVTTIASETAGPNAVRYALGVRRFARSLTQRAGRPLSSGSGGNKVQS
ncbi:hypothetical protein SAMN05443247_04746 [Bradyrhizobium erythrophlei]|jgi:hypothetical protein|nr:hypothetical protein SAMN05443247_04746 [Bradyrhizobium erythrophlei]